MKIALLCMLAAPLLAACGDDGGSTKIDAPPVATDGPPGVIDAPLVTIDAPTLTQTVEVAPCAGGEPLISGILGDNSKYTPNTATVAVGGLVKFILPASHNVMPDPGSDDGLRVGFNETKCLKFTAAGTFGFHCGPHGFKGTITVN